MSTQTHHWIVGLYYGSWSGYESHRTCDGWARLIEGDDWIGVGVRVMAVRVSRPICWAWCFNRFVFVLPKVKVAHVVFTNARGQSGIPGSIVFASGGCDGRGWELGVSQTSHSRERAFQFHTSFGWAYEKRLNRLDSCWYLCRYPHTCTGCMYRWQNQEYTSLQLDRILKTAWQVMILITNACWKSSIPNPGCITSRWSEGCQGQFRGPQAAHYSCKYLITNFIPWLISHV